MSDRRLSPPEARGENDPKYKTTLCRFWQETGYCHQAGRCSFAHGLKDLRSFGGQPKTQDPQNPQNYPELYACTHKTSPHVPAAFRSSGLHCLRFHTPSLPSLRRFKTRNCTRWAAGYCERGDNCAFAHGTKELRILPSAAAAAAAKVAAPAPSALPPEADAPVPPKTKPGISYSMMAKASATNIELPRATDQATAEANALHFIMSDVEGKPRSLTTAVVKLIESGSLLRSPHPAVIGAISSAGAAGLLVPKLQKKLQEAMPMLPCFIKLHPLAAYLEGYPSYRRRPLCTSKTRTARARRGSPPHLQTAGHLSREGTLCWTRPSRRCGCATPSTRRRSTRRSAP